MSSIEIRRITGAEHLPLSSYAFGPSPEPRERLRSDSDQLEKQSDSVRLGVFDGDTPLAVAVGLPMRQNVRGVLLPMLGVAGVTTDPRARRRGYVRQLLGRLHEEFVADGFVVSALWPFRGSFYQRFGYASIPCPRSIRLSGSGLASVRALELPGEVTLHRWDECADTVADYLEAQRERRHGFALPGREHLTDVRQDAWVALAHRDAAVVGMLIYHTEGIGGSLQGRTLLYDDPTARMLLLQWLALHEDQFESFRFGLPAGESPELWYADAAYDDETRVAIPTRTAPMVRVLSVEGLGGIRTGEAVATVRVVDDPYLAGSWTLDGTGGTLAVSRLTEDGASAPLPETAISAAGLSALVYGTLRPDELGLHGFGTVDAATAAALDTLFPPATPFLYAQF